MVPRIAAVVILFHPEESVIANIYTYIRDVETLYIFDNSPSSSKEVLKRIERSDKIRYLTENKNVGIGTALNITPRKRSKSSMIIFSQWTKIAQLVRTWLA
jgi:GT2 family glycosyltransferase